MADLASITILCSEVTVIIGALGYKIDLDGSFGPATATSQSANSMTDMFSSDTESNIEYHINTTYWLPKTASVIIS